MPVVTFFHSIRENVFLNTRTTEAAPLESFGNFFLTPSQYLFGGKTISMRDKDRLDFEVKQSFDYGEWYWPKTVMSLLVLPLFEPLGISLKGISYLSAEVRKRHRHIEAMLQDKLVRSRLQEYKERGFGSFYSEDYIPCQGHKRPSFLTKKQKIEIKALKELISLLEANNIIYWIDFGTCLGAYRYGGIIPWDYDIDIGILEEDHENVRKVLSTLDPVKYQVQDWSSYSKPNTLLKLFIKETKNFIDIYHYRTDTTAKTIQYIFTFENSPFPESWKKSEIEASQKPLRYDQIFPLRKASFDGLTVWAPNDAIEFLHTKYGENLDPSMVWDEQTLTYLKVEDHPYWKS